MALSKARKKIIWAGRKKVLRTAGSALFNRSYIGYAGWNGSGNLGDEGVYEAAKELFPEIKPFSAGSPVRWIETATRRKVPLKAFYLGGGTLINLSSEWLQNAEYAYNNSIPSFCIGTGVALLNDFWKKPSDEFHDDMKRWAEILRKFEYVGVRGPRSKASLLEVGLETEVVGDAAFILAPDKYKKKPPRKILGLNVSYGTHNVMWGNPDVFIGEVVDFIQKIAKDSFEIRLLPIWQDDVEISKLVLEKANTNSCKLVTAYESTRQYIDEVGKCDLFVGEKLHATIFAAMLRIPSVMLAYRPKCIDFMESMDMGQYTIKTDELDSKQLLAMCMELMERHTSITEQLDHHTLFYKNLQQKRAKQLRRKLL